MNELSKNILGELSKLSPEYLKSDEGMALIASKRDYIRKECCRECAHNFVDKAMSLMYRDISAGNTNDLQTK